MVLEVRTPTYELGHTQSDPHRGHLRKNLKEVREGAMWGRMFQKGTSQGGSLKMGTCLMSPRDSGGQCDG